MVQEPRRSRRVAVIDGDPGVCSDVGRVLYYGGFATETFTSASAFIKARPWERCELLVTGMQTPSVDGLRLLGHLLDEDVSVPVLMLTGSHEPALRGQALAAEAMSFLERP